MSNIPPYFDRGKIPFADRLNALIDMVRQSIVQPGTNYTVSRSWNGTTLAIQQGGSSGSSGGTAESLPCPFKVTDASEGENMKVMIDWGLIWQMLPTGMHPDNKPPLVMDVSDDCYVYSYMKFNKDSLILEEVKFTIESDFVQNTSEVQYNLIARVLVDTDTKSNTKSIVSIKNLCIQPFPSPCALTA